MASYSVFMMMLVATFGGTGGHLLDYADTQAYWKAKNVAVSIETMAAEAKAAQGHEKAHQVRQLMAIRALGELKQKNALPALKPLLESKDLFIAEYAQRAVNAIEGKPLPPAGPTAEQRKTDLWLLPADSRLVAQFAMPAPAQTATIDKLLDNLPAPLAANKAEMLADITREVITIAELIGDVRLDGVTLGLSGDIGPNKGSVVIVGRGLYDAKALMAQAKKDQVPVDAVNGQNVLKMDDEAVLLCPSNDQLVLIAGASPDQLPIDAMTKAVAAQKGALATAQDMVKLIESIDTAQPLWAAVKMTDSYRQVPLAAAKAFDTATLVLTRKDGMLNFEIKAQGADADQAKAAVDEINLFLVQAVAKMQQVVVQMPAFKPAVEFVETIKLATDGANARLTATMKEDAAGMGILPMFFFGAHAVPAPPPAAIEVQEQGQMIEDF